MTTTSTTARRIGLRAAMVVIAGVAVGVPTAVILHPPAFPKPPPRVALPAPRIAPPEKVPVVEPMDVVDLTPQDAEAYNASIPFFDGPNPAARAFRFAGASDDLQRATDCLAAGVLYEAGDDAAGEKAVAQVVLNRVRHPAFPQTICAVVFEGSERATGCQFSFTCDGSMQHWHPTADQWKRARAIASAALSGTVYKPVGYATHYHTDWVVPYWQSTLDKIAKVHSHLFFRWTGWWGTPGAFRSTPTATEPNEAQMAAISSAHDLAGAMLEADAAMGEANIALGKPMVPLASDANAFLAVLSAKRPAPSFVTVAKAACGDRPFCRVLVWTDPKNAAMTLPLTTQQVAALSYSYTRNRQFDLDKSLWDCTLFPHPDRQQCMKRQILLVDEPATARLADTVAADPAKPATTAPARAAPLTGVRRTAPASAVPSRDQAAMNISGGKAISEPAPPSILRRNDPASGKTRSAK